MDVTGFTTFVVPPGIGDFAWIYMKLCNLGYPINIEISSPRDETGPRMRRCDGLLDLLPQVKSHRYLDYAVWLNDDYCELDYGRAWIQANLHLENGNRIEEFIPELPTSLHFDIDLPDTNFRNKIVLYTSSLRANLAWNGWDADDWITLIERLDCIDDIVIVGSEWDNDYLSFFSQFNELTVWSGRPLADVLAMIKHAKCTIGFPSGIPIMSTILNTPTYMFYPRHLDKMMHAWHDTNTQYCPALYGSQAASIDTVLKWAKKWI